jgi:hypothetical protein
MKCILIAAGLIGLAILSIVTWQGHKTALSLKEENHRLRSRLADLELEKTTSSAAAAEPSSVSPELLRLRGEVAQLRRQTNEMETLQKENTRLKSELSSATQAAAQARAAAQAQSRPAPSDLTGVGTAFPRETWAFAGYASPEDTLKTAVWAMSIGNPNAFLATLSPTERAGTERRWQGKTEDEIAAESRREMEKLTGFRILDRQTISDDEVVLRVMADGDEGDVRRMRMKRLGSEWKFDGVSKARKVEPPPQ